MSQIPREKIWVALDYWKEADLSGNLSDVIDRLAECKDKYHHAGHEEIELSVEHDTGYYGCEGLNIVLRGYRWETDIEFQRRVKLIEEETEFKRKFEERKAKEERAEYLRLKRKFEGKK